MSKTKTPPKPKRPPLYTKLDGKPPSRPRGKHAVVRSDTSGEDAPPREIIPIAANQRLGFRPNEYAALLGISIVSVWRGIKSGEIEIVEQGGIKFIPRAFVIKQGFITTDDNF